MAENITMTFVQFPVIMYISPPALDITTAVGKSSMTITFNHVRPQPPVVTVKLGEVSINYHNIKL